MSHGSPFHFRPDDGGYVGDCIPFYWAGVYHVFYLKRGFGGTPWAHIASRDLVNWAELPTALPIGEAGEHDGGDCWTGSVIEHEGTFHIFYTGHNEALDRKQVIMHATSPDLISWEKDPANPVLVIDNALYEGQDFRDPFVFWNDDEGCFWMTISARETGAPVPAAGCVGLATSTDLMNWDLQPPLWAPRKIWCPECSDVFPATGRWFMLYSTHVTAIATAPNPRGPWQAPPNEFLDCPRNYAIKRLFDGQRHVAFGWVASREGETDSGNWEWGGHMCIPRELVCRPNGCVCVRPVEEVLHAFSRPVMDEAGLQEIERVTGAWRVDGDCGVGRKLDGRALGCLRVSDNYLFQACLSFDNPSARAHIVLRMSDGYDAGYAVSLEPALHRTRISTWGPYGPGEPIFQAPLCVEQPPTSVRIFVQGNVLEVFVGDQVALVSRMYDRPSGTLGLVAENGSVTFEHVRITDR